MVNAGQKNIDTGILRVSDPPTALPKRKVERCVRELLAWRIGRAHSLPKLLNESLVITCIKKVIKLRSALALSRFILKK